MVVLVISILVRGWRVVRSTQDGAARADINAPNAASLGEVNVMVRLLWLLPWSRNEARGVLNPVI
jgi:hypothetical protein